MAITKMDWQKNLLLAAMAAVVIMLVIRFNDFQQTYQPPVAVAQTTNSVPDANTDIPTVSETPETGPSTTTNEATDSAAQVIQITTDTLQLAINTRGGDIQRVALPQYYAQVDTPDQPFELINNSAGLTYVVQSGLVGTNGTDTSAGRPVFTSESQSYQLADGQDSLTVDLTLQQDEVTITKRFIFHRGEYRVDLEYLINNQGSTPWQANLYGQIKRDSHAPSSDTGIGMKPFVGPAITTLDERYSKYSFGDLEDKSVKTNIQGGWVAMVQHYFISAWIPDAEKQNTFSLRQLNNQDLYLFGFTSSATSVAPGSSGTINAQFYAGPKDTDKLEIISPHLELTVDYGWLWWLAMPMFGFLKWIYAFIGNWGLSIIALTIIIKAIFFKLSATSYRSMARMRKLSPKMAELKERYGDDRQKMSQETMKLYKEEKVNPLGGCLPMLIQMPVFLALYWVLMESVELRHTPFLWMADLSVKDPIFVLPLLMGFTMWLTMRLNPTPPDPMQAKIMQFMPVVFTVMFLWFPAGLVLYWVTNNTLSFLQQMIITRQIDNAEGKT